MLKERVFSQLQEIGQASRKIIDQTNPYDEDQELVEALTALRNARFNRLQKLNRIAYGESFRMICLKLKRSSTGKPDQRMRILTNEEIMHEITIQDISAIAKGT